MSLIGAMRALDGGRDLALLTARLCVGSFLIYGVIDNVLSPARMTEFVEFLARFGFQPAGFWAPASVFAQLGVGVALIAGCAVRAAGAILAINFLVALIMVDADAGVRAAFPSTALVLFGLIWLCFGAGRFSLDRLAETGMRGRAQASVDR